MPRRKFSVPYGKSSLAFSLPSSLQVTIAVPRKTLPLRNPLSAIKRALAHPVGSAPLRDLTHPGDRVCIVFTDITRSSPDHLLVPALLEDLEKAGIRDKDITLLCGVGMHRPSTQEEKINKLGAGVVSRYPVIDHEPQNPQALVDLGTTRSGAPIQIHREAVEADLLIATGVVEPHQYAGYSGGGKTVAIGAAGEALIAHSHGPAFIDHAGTRLGRIEGNPFHELITEVARRASLCFILNVVLDANKSILRVTAGDPEAASQELVAYARSIYEVHVPHPFDIIIGGVGYPKDSNLYQASRAPSYLFFAPFPLLRPGGFFIIPARCEEGAGTGVGEGRFLTAMQDAPDIQSILEEARRKGYPPGQQRAFIMAKVLEGARVMIVGSECPQVVSACKMIPVTTMEEAVEIACRELGRSCQALIVPHAMLTLPVIAQ